MTRHRVAVVGAGSQGRVHAQAYAAHPDVDIVAVIDVDATAADRLADEFDVDARGTEPGAVLAAARPDIVSVCTPPAWHLDTVVSAVEAGAAAVHCEKPVALSYGDVLAMDRATREAGVQLTFNLQRRFESVHRFARRRLREGAIGDLVSLEGYCPNLPDWGTHIIDLMFFYAEDAPVEWVLGQVDVTLDRYVYGAFTETSSLTQMRWPSGVGGIVVTGREPQTPVLNLANNLGLVLQGTRGRIDVRGSAATVLRFGAEDEVHLAPFDRDPERWERGVDPAIIAATSDAVADLVHALDSGATSELAAEHGVAASEIIFATYESSRARRRVRLPLDVLENQLLAGVAAGEWTPTGELRSTW